MWVKVGIIIFTFAICGSKVVSCKQEYQNQLFMNDLRAFVFNADTDLALAQNKPSYTASAPVRQMMADLAMLPVWYAGKGNMVLVENDDCKSYYESLNDMFSFDVTLVASKDLSSLEFSAIVPWGWNKALVNAFSRRGIPPNLLPDNDELAYWRNLSSRTSVTGILDPLRDGDSYVGESINVTSLNECESLASSFKEGVVFKSPWSSSGKGLMWCRNGLDAGAAKWCGSVLADQGSVVVSPIYNKVCDFAMEFFLSDDHASFVGYSSFITDSRGRYQGNSLLPDSDIENKLCGYVPSDELVKVKNKLVEILSDYHYQGYVGVDMMICSTDDSSRYKIHPCVELNLRMNMGVVSHILYESYVSSESFGMFQVEHFASNCVLRDYCAKQTRDNPLVVEQKRVKSGFLPLVPVNDKTLNIAYINVFAG